MNGWIIMMGWPAGQCHDGQPSWNYSRCQDTNNTSAQKHFLYVPEVHTLPLMMQFTILMKQETSSPEWTHHELWDDLVFHWVSILVGGYLICKMYCMLNVIKDLKTRGKKFLHSVPLHLSNDSLRLVLSGPARLTRLIKWKCSISIVCDENISMVSTSPKVKENWEVMII